ncbi:MAG: hypothetical protein A3D65_01290 [Candidatus Lloydbacteria bacterium RIFCSPHIGHO2_02_FULL_50_13]|uniref:Transcription regulator TrmB N-terminal domain-containing protein n=1 Tax=Candidatus Lloydbacteria bacterium RIFCSPHIGHO2_02_FULL_50_13 TaxID=1798661 RepID=A0A1G2D4X8_9BACT|nr:MAG: hypothetical protein A3D65_01290 [Candidatus Lloydbacteria bacterium RIFCSPHIGHO2_02_FULL_50_13]
MVAISSKNALRGIGLSEKEARILLSLFEKGSMTVSDLARVVSLPRTTVAFVLDELKVRGYAERVKVRGHFEWEAVEISTIVDDATARFRSFENEIPLLREMVKTQDCGRNFSVRAYTTETGMVKAYNLIIELHRGDRVYYFEGRSSVEAKFRFSEEVHIRWQEAASRSGVIMESLDSEKMLDSLWKTKSEKFWRSHLDRKLIMYLLPDEIMNFACDICVFGKTVMLFTPAQDTAIIIESRELSEALQKLFQGLKTLGRKTNFADEIRKRLNAKK